MGGTFTDRTEAVQQAWVQIHRECRHHVETQVHVPLWDRWRYRCSAPGCDRHGHSWDEPTTPCGLCGGDLEAVREEARLDLEVRALGAPRTFYDVTVRHAVPGDATRAGAAASRDGAVVQEAEGTKKTRYPDGRTPWRCVPLALDTYGRHGRQALQHLRALAKERSTQEVEGDGAERAASVLVQRWAAQLSVALHRANAAVLWSALGSERAPVGDLAEELAG